MQAPHARHETPAPKRQPRNASFNELIFANFMGRLDFLSRPFYGIC